LPVADNGCDIVRRYNEAWLSRDLAGMAGFLGEDLVLWHNHIGQEFTKEQMLSFVGDALKVLQKVEFRNARRTASETGCIQQHDLYCEMGDGGVVDNAPQVIVYTVRDGLIRRIEEYIDGPALAVTGIKG
jgi:ketosteroid isomerase-like protein